MNGLQQTNWIHLFTSFDGRITRTQFWIGVAVLAVVELLLALVNQQIANDRIGAVTDLVLLYPEFAVATKRGHDRNNPTWVVGLFFALSAAFDLLVLGGLIENSKIDTSNMFLLIMLGIIGLFALVLFIDLGFRRGTQGPNRFGPDPLEARA